jgi:hypothetical protein
MTKRAALAELRALFPNSHFTSVSESHSAFDKDAPTHHWTVTVQEQRTGGVPTPELEKQWVSSGGSYGTTT